MKKNTALSIGIFAVTLITYLLTACRTITWGDAPELATAVYTLGITHPTGYPLFCLLGKLFTYLPFGTISYRIVIMVAIFAAFANLFLYLNIRKLTRNDIAAVSATLMFAFSQIFWSQAIISDVIAVNAFFFSVIIYLALSWKDSKNFKTMELLALVLGFSFTNHMSTMFLVPALLYLVIAEDRSIFRPNKLFKLIGLFILPLTLYAYLPLRSATHPVMNWGKPYNLPNFIDHVSGAQYRFLMFHKTLGQLYKDLVKYANYIVIQYNIFLYWIGIIGAWQLWKNHRRFFYFSLFIYAANIIYAVNYDVYDVNDYFVPSNLVFGIWFGFGLLIILNFISNIKVWKNALVYMAGGAILLLPVIRFSCNLDENNQSKDFAAYDYARAVSKIMAPNSLLFTGGDFNYFPLMYTFHVKNMRPDIKVISYNMCLIPWGYSDLLDEALAGKLKGFPVQTRPKYFLDKDKSLTRGGKKIILWRRPNKLFANTAFSQVAEAYAAKIHVYNNIANSSDDKIFPNTSLYTKKLSKMFMGVNSMDELVLKLPDVRVKNPKPQHPCFVDYSSQTLIGYDTDSDAVNSGDLLKITLYWRMKSLPKHKLFTYIAFDKPVKGQYTPDTLYKPWGGIGKFLYGADYSKLIKAGDIVREDKYLILTDYYQTGEYEIFFGLAGKDTNLLTINTGGFRNNNHLARIGKIRINPRPSVEPSL